MMGNKDIWDAIETAGSGEHLDEEMFEFISAYADGECSAKERRLVEAYLAENANGRELLADLRMQTSMLSEDLVDSPDWLRASILSKTTERRTLKWPFAAGIAATAAAAAAVALIYGGPNVDTFDSNELVASNVKQQPTLEQPFQAPSVSESFSEPVNEEPAQSVPTKAAVESPKPRTQPRTSNFIQASNTNVESEVEQPVIERPMTITPEEVKRDDNTYAVAEYGSGRFESKQPDVFETEIHASEVPKSTPAASPAVLPDAREKLRDRVKKINQEKLEIDDKEKSGA